MIRGGPIGGQEAARTRPVRSNCAESRKAFSRSPAGSMYCPTYSHPRERIDTANGRGLRAIRPTDGSAHTRRGLADPEKFLYFDSLPEKQKRSLLARLHAGQVFVEPVRTRDNGDEIRVPDGLVHHWLAIGFIPGVTRDRVLALAEDYSRHPEVYAPDVQRARVLSHSGEHFSVYYRFYRHAIVTAEYNTEFDDGTIFCPTLPEPTALPGRFVSPR